MTPAEARQKALEILSTQTDYQQFNHKTCLCAGLQKAGIIKKRWSIFTMQFFSPGEISRKLGVSKHDARLLIGLGPVRFKKYILEKASSS